MKIKHNFCIRNHLTTNHSRQSYYITPNHFYYLTCNPTSHSVQGIPFHQFAVELGNNEYYIFLLTRMEIRYQSLINWCQYFVPVSLYLSWMHCRSLTLRSVIAGFDCTSFHPVKDFRMTLIKQCTAAAALAWPGYIKSKCIIILLWNIVVVRIEFAPKQDR